AKNSGCKPGKQQGAKGNAMPWVSAPDEWVPHRPQGRCGCGTDLADALDVGIARSLWVPNWSSTSCDLGVFVYQPTEQITTSEVKLGRRRGRW
ncbi:MAG TPA: hypothetical protein VGL88_12365, partial [Pseudonocardiaceae bacterium]